MKEEMVERDRGKKWRKEMEESFLWMLWAFISSERRRAQLCRLPERRRRRRISITAGWAAKGSEACGLLTNNIKSSSKRANIWRTFKACLCSPSSRTFYCLSVKPQVTFASLSSPAVMDIRRLRRRSLEKICLWRHSSYALENILLMPLKTLFLCL